MSPYQKSKSVKKPYCLRVVKSALIILKSNQSTQDYHLHHLLTYHRGADRLPVLRTHRINSKLPMASCLRGLISTSYLSDTEHSLCKTCG
jgi:hypothetical protein